mmetsp:Transcript_1333/g.5709  ORF Transcript_1333/g.5709 Transcript_1333/m.5709 type:complete len:82 (-) Transcript_1333:141-386(-)
MKVRVLFFANARDLAGTGEAEVELPEGADTSALREELAEKFADLRDLVQSITLAVNQEYTHELVELHDGDEVALIPPISGG